MYAKTRKRLVAAIALLLLFVVFTVLVRTVDVQPIGPNGTEVGFAKLNSAVHTSLCENTSVPIEPFYKVSKYLGYLSLLLVALFGLIGLKQLIHRKSLKKVDYRIVALGGFYIAVGVCYVLFDKVIAINYRPVLEADGTLESSFPSSHTMLACCVLVSAMFIFPKLLGKPIGRCVNVLCGALAAVIIICRLFSGVHWMTDIIGGVLLSAALIMFYAAALSHLHHKYRRKKRRHHSR